MKPLNLDGVEEMGATTFKKLPAGGYVCMITGAQSNDEQQYMEIMYEIAEGEYKGIFSDEYGKANPWAHSCRSYWKGKAAGMFKHFLACIDKSNGTHLVDLCKTGFMDEALNGRLIGIVFREEEYMSNKGEIRTRTRQYSYCTADEIRQGNFKVPEKEKYVPTDTPSAKVTGNESFMQVSDSELPTEW